MRLYGTWHWIRTNYLRDMSPALIRISFSGILLGWKLLPQMAAHYFAVISMKCLKLGVPTPDWIDWCSKPDLNRHALRQKFLRLSWLPISPFEHINALMYSYICGITGFCDYTKFQKHLISPGYKKPSNPFIRTKGFDKTTTLVLFIFFSQTSVVVSSYKNRFSC